MIAGLTSMEGDLNGHPQKRLPGNVHLSQYIEGIAA